MERSALVIAFRQLMESCIDSLEKGGVKPEVVYKTFLQRKNNLLMQIDMVSNRRDHMGLMMIANKAYINPTARGNKDTLVREFRKALSNLPTALNGYKPKK